MEVLTAEAFELYAANNQWLLLWPEIAVALLALSVLILDLLGGTFRAAMRGVTIAVLGVLAILVVATPLQETIVAFSGLVKIDALSEWMRAFFLLASLLVVVTAGPMFKRAPTTEYLHILLVITAGLMLLSVSDHFVMLFVSLETVTVGLFVLVGYLRDEPRSLEASLKYLVLGSFSSGLLLFGLVMVYGAASAPLLAGMVSDPMGFGDVQSFFALYPDNPIGLIGALLVLVGVAFKLGVVPFQIWIPDVYQGAPVATTSLLAVSSKAGGLVVMINLIQGPFAPMQDSLVPLLGIVAVASILFGNLAALPQQKVKRLIGLSGISHAGYLLLGVIAATEVAWALSAVLFYLFAYLLANFAVLLTVSELGEGDALDHSLADYGEMVRQRPFLGGVLAIGIGSLAGIPPLAGFIGKLLVFVALYEAGMGWLLAFGILGVVISIFYYFGWILTMFVRPVPAVFDPAGSAPPPTPAGPAISRMSGVVLIGVSALTVVGGLAQGVIVALLP